MLGLRMGKIWLMQLIGKMVGQPNELSHAELVDLSIDSRDGYVPSKLALQMVEDDLAAQRQVMPIVIELTVWVSLPRVIQRKQRAWLSFLA
jgi:hypothetical protein